VTEPQGKPPDPPTSPPPSVEAPPPLFGTWRRAYLVVAGTLGLWVFLFWLVTARYS
jgi:hypothetical protein